MWKVLNRVLKLSESGLGFTLKREQEVSENLDCLDDIHQGKFNIIYASSEAAMNN